MKSETDSTPYERYHIDTQPAPDLIPWPNRFLVQVSKIGLAKLLIQEIIHQRGDMAAVTSRPCVYGTFSGPIGGFAPRPQHCVGCLRCTVQHPDMVTIRPNPAREKLGDQYFDFKHINAVVYEAETGSIPVKGAGYRGKFGGQGWNGMWTDMSEIVRPTRDGIHGREFISTVVDIGEKPRHLAFDAAGQPIGTLPHTFSIPIPFIFDRPVTSTLTPSYAEILVRAARESQTLVVIPVEMIIRNGLLGNGIIPLIQPGEEKYLSDLGFVPRLIELDGTRGPEHLQPSVLQQLTSTLPDSLLALRLPFGDPKALLAYYDMGIRIFHLIADLHGRNSNQRFVIDLIRQAHLAFVEVGRRDEVTLIGSGGIVAAEHVPKAIICGLDLVALDTPLLAALQVDFGSHTADRELGQFNLPAALTLDWGVQRIKNLIAAWRDQLLEIMGAMGLREVRRLRGEIGRAMFQADLEREAFAEIEGYLE